MQKERPLSPHLMIYRPQMTMILSITHRGTGVFLALGTPLLILWLLAVAQGPASYADFQACASHWLAKLFLAGWTFAVFYHLCNGIRHLFWDIGKGYEMADLYRSGWTVVIVSSALTLATLYFAFMGGGA